MSQKVDHPTDGNYFVKTWPIFIFFTLGEEWIVNKTYIACPTAPKICYRTTRGKQRFKSATSCARLVDLLWGPSASQSLPSRTSSLSIRRWRSTAAITATCPWRSNCCPWCVTCQAISLSVNKTAHLHTGHVTLCDFWVVNIRFHSSRSVAAKYHRP